MNVARLSPEMPLYYLSLLSFQGGPECLIDRNSLSVTWLVVTALGVTVGEVIDARLGITVGELVSFAVGVTVGELVGSAVGLTVGAPNHA